jgi:hypothetical protein
MAPPFDPHRAGFSFSEARPAPLFLPCKMTSPWLNSSYMGLTAGIRRVVSTSNGLASFVDVITIFCAPCSVAFLNREISSYLKWSNRNHEKVLSYRLLWRRIAARPAGASVLAQWHGGRHVD